MLGHMSRRQPETRLAASLALGGIGVRALRRHTASGRDAVQASNKRMERTVLKRHTLCKNEEQRVCRFSPAAHSRC
jgi:hypothetical protein